MKRRWVLSVMIMLWVWPSPGFTAEELAWEKKLPFKTATINYTIKGMENGKETLYIRDHGRERATYRETTSNMMGVKMTNRTIEFKTPDFIYTYDLEKRQGVKGVNPQKLMLEEYNKMAPGDQKKVRENAGRMGAAFTEGMGGEVQQNAAKILGYDCDKVAIMGGSSTYLIHDTDITLKSDMKMMGMKFTMVADSVDKGPVEDKVFEHPAGITAAADGEADKMARHMATQALAMLKDPEKAKNTQMMPQLAIPSGEMTAEDKEMMQQVQQMMQGAKAKQAQ